MDILRSDTGWNAAQGHPRLHPRGDRRTLPVNSDTAQSDPALYVGHNYADLMNWASTASCPLAWLDFSTIALSRPHANLLVTRTRASTRRAPTRGAHLLLRRPAITRRRSRPTIGVDTPRTKTPSTTMAVQQGAPLPWTHEHEHLAPQHEGLPTFPIIKGTSGPEITRELMDRCKSLGHTAMSFQRTELFIDRTKHEQIISRKGREGANGKKEIGNRQRSCFRKQRRTTHACMHIHLRTSSHCGPILLHPNSSLLFSSSFLRSFADLQNQFVAFLGLLKKCVDTMTGITKLDVGYYIQTTHPFKEIEMLKNAVQYRRDAYGRMVRNRPGTETARVVTAPREGSNRRHRALRRQIARSVTAPGRQTATWEVKGGAKMVKSGGLVTRRNSATCSPHRVDRPNPRRDGTDRATAACTSRSSLGHCSILPERNLRDGSAGAGTSSTRRRSTAPSPRRVADLRHHLPHASRRERPSDAARTAYAHPQRRRHQDPCGDQATPGCVRNVDWPQRPDHSSDQTIRQFRNVLGRELNRRSHRFSQTLLFPMGANVYERV